MLTVGGAVQGARPIDRAGAAMPADPLVELALAAAPNAKAALVIGLGTGKTASELAARGISVRVVEIDPAVVELAKKWFDWNGETTIADAAEELTTTKQMYDIVLLDAELRVGKSGSAFERGTLGEAPRVLKKGGVLAARFTATQTRGAEMGPAFGMHYAVYGNGIADEDQTIYAIGGEEPLDLVMPKDIGLMRVPGARGDANVDPGLFSVKRERHVSIIGYLVRLPEDGSVAVDLPHYEMGAVRFRLHGAIAEELAKRLPAKATFPTQGDISSDGDVKQTLAPLLGGGGYKRSDVRFSPVVVSLEGTARLHADVSPDHAFAGRVLERGPSQDPVREKLLPYGGTLYELDVDRIAWSLDTKQFGEMKKQAAASTDKAAKLVTSGKLADAATAIQRSEDALHAIGPDAADRIPQLRELHALSLRLTLESGRYVLATTPLARAASCDRARGPTQLRGWLFPSPAKALYDCAVREYKAAFAKEQTSEEAKQAVARLLGLYDGEPFSDENAKATEDLKRRFPDAEPEAAPPP